MDPKTCDEGEVVVGVSAFKPHSLALIEGVASGRLRRVVLTKRGQPVAALVPVDKAPKELWGALADIMQPVAGMDLGAPTGGLWKAECE